MRQIILAVVCLPRAYSEIVRGQIFAKVINGRQFPELLPIIGHGFGIDIAPTPNRFPVQTVLPCNRQRLRF